MRRALRQSVHRNVSWHRILTLLVLAGGLGGLCLSPSTVIAQSQQNRDFRPRRVLPPRPPITDPPLLSGTKAASQIADNELVLGVVVNDEARAYPINMLNGPSREIINDMLGGVPIAATWCHLCHNAVVFDRHIKDQTLQFHVSGWLWNRNLVMQDTQTDSQWSHFLGRAMAGPLEGSRLETFPSELTTWGQWRRKHEDTTVLNLPRSSKQFVRDVHRKPENFVYGFLIDGHAYHASFAVLQQSPLINLEYRGRVLLISFDPTGTSAQLFERSLDEQTLTFHSTEDGRMQDLQTDTIWSPQTGVAISGPLEGRSLTQQVGMPAFIEAWKTFHPDSQEVKAGDAAPEQAD